VQTLAVDPADVVSQGGTLAIRGEVFSPDGRAPSVLVGIVRADGTPVYGVATDMDRVTPRKLAHDRFGFSLTLTDLALLPGKYMLRAHAMDPEGVRSSITSSGPSSSPATRASLGSCGSRTVGTTMVSASRSSSRAATSPRVATMSSCSMPGTIPGDECFEKLRRCAASDARIGTVGAVVVQTLVPQETDVDLVNAALDRSAPRIYPDFDNDGARCMYIKQRRCARPAG
jgi:hypothetical protein